VADVVYKTAAYYDPEVDYGFAYDDPAVGIEWPVGLELSASARDAAAPSLAEMAASLPFADR
jgi:dTDP-4-dehydrorhamnose 3,5-epimerase